MGTPQFKVGDKVRRLSTEYHSLLGVKEHTVVGYKDDGRWMYLEGVYGGWTPSLFERVEDALPTTDSVNHPAHYNAGPVEVIDYILQVCKHYSGEEAPLVANVIKYISRAPLKGKMKEDLKKAQWYLNKLVDNLP
jgi:hypothetical protein